MCTRDRVVCKPKSNVKWRIQLITIRSALSREDNAVIHRSHGMIRLRHEDGSLVCLTVIIDINLWNVTLATDRPLLPTSVPCKGKLMARDPNENTVSDIGLSSLKCRCPIFVVKRISNTGLRSWYTISNPQHFNSPYNWDIFVYPALSFSPLISVTYRALSRVEHASVAGALYPDQKQYMYNTAQRIGSDLKAVILQMIFSKPVCNVFNVSCKSLTGIHFHLVIRLNDTYQTGIACYRKFIRTSQDFILNNQHCSLA